MTNPSENYFSWPGKSPVEGSEIYHPAVYHMLDVGAVLKQLLEPCRFNADHLDALVFLGILHDLGKINDRFKSMIEEGAVQGKPHWEVSMAWFTFFDQSILEGIFGNEQSVRRPLYAASAGHHGGAPTADARAMRKLINAAGSTAKEDAELFIKDLQKLFPNASLEGIELTMDEAGGDWRGSSNALSWWFSGVLSVSDWIGSNVEWFSACPPEIDIKKYWLAAQKKAKHALKECGLAAASVTAKPAESMFQFTDFTPMQRKVLDVAIPEGPTLFILEDSTGSGKTEASLLLAQRMMQADKASGVFFALPTTSTSNAMFYRLKKLSHMFEGTPSIALAHSKASLHEGFEKIIKGGRIGAESSAEMTCTNWFADGRRKSLLAQIGVGTIDQALMGILPTRFCSLRLYALSQKILIIDEAHDYDPYVQRELEALLSFQAMLGGSAILMTATLPSAKRDMLINAFQANRDGFTQNKAARNYPQMSILSEHEQVFPIASAVREEHSTIEVEKIASIEAAIELLVESANSGAACAFIRNSVDGAVEVAEALEERGVKVLLHHARFTLNDRSVNEKLLLDRFGKNGVGRKGWVVVGTQVLEHSLDIDFDVMVSDLAPMSALIQRAGRLWRHREYRSAAQRGVKKPVLYVLSPDPDIVEDENWAQPELGVGRFVYSLSLLWKTAYVVFGEGAIVAPSLNCERRANIRTMIEAADGESDIDVPQIIEEADAQAIGQSIAERYHAQQNVFDTKSSYADAVRVFDDKRFPTRLGEEQIVLRLACWAQGKLLPMVELEDEYRGWVMSEVSLSRRKWEKFYKKDYQHPELTRLEADLKKWERESIRICPVGNDGLLENAEMKYHAKTGLTPSLPERG